jgi:uncharacterized membrane protein YczE
VGVPRPHLAAGDVGAVVGLMRWPIRRPGRTVQLLVGLVISAVGIWLTIEARLGVAPWEVLHIGLATKAGIGIGTASIVTGAALVVVVAIAGVRPGVGTVLNVVTIGAVLNVLLAFPWLDGLGNAAVVWRATVLLVGIAVFAVGCATYVGAHLGPGPRDGLMVAVHLRGGVPVGVARGISEGAGLSLGWVLGGPIGAGTIVFVICAGPAVGLAFTLLDLQPVRRSPPV